MSKGCLTKWIMIFMCLYHAVFRKPRWLKGCLSPGWLELFNYCFGIGVWFGIISLNFFSKRSSFLEPLSRASSPQRRIVSNPWQRSILGFWVFGFFGGWKRLSLVPRSHALKCHLFYPADEVFLQLPRFIQVHGFVSKTAEVQFFSIPCSASSICQTRSSAGAWCFVWLFIGDFWQFDFSCCQ